MRYIFILVVMVFAFGCGTVRYSLVAEKGRRGHQEVAWDAVSFNFNNLWLKLAGKE